MKYLLESFKHFIKQYWVKSPLNLDCLKDEYTKHLNLINNEFPSSLIEINSSGDINFVENVKTTKKLNESKSETMDSYKILLNAAEDHLNDFEVFKKVLKNDFWLKKYLLNYEVDNCSIKKAIETLSSVYSNFESPNLFKKLNREFSEIIFTINNILEFNKLTIYNKLKGFHVGSTGSIRNSFEIFNYCFSNKKQKNLLNEKLDKKIVDIFLKRPIYTEKQFKNESETEILINKIIAALNETSTGLLEDESAFKFKVEAPTTQKCTKPQQKNQRFNADAFMREFTTSVNNLNDLNNEMEKFLIAIYKKVGFDKQLSDIAYRYLKIRGVVTSFNSILFCINLMNKRDFFINAENSEIGKSKNLVEMQEDLNETEEHILKNFLNSIKNLVSNLILMSLDGKILKTLCSGNKNIFKKKKIIKQDVNKINFTLNDSSFRLYGN